MSQNLSEQEILRRDKLKQLEELGINPYPAEKWEVNIKSAQALKEYNDELKNFPDVSMAGRLMAIRLMGKAAFLRIQDRFGQAQLFLQKEAVGESAFQAFKLADIGDVVGVSGTPTLFINGRNVPGGAPVDLLKKIVDFQASQEKSGK